MDHPPGRDRVQSFVQRLGLAVRARKVALGSDAALAAISSLQAKLVVVAGDAGQNAAKKFRDKCSFYEIPMVVCLDRVALGQACGKSQTVVIAVTDPGFAAKLAENAGEISGGVLFDKTSRV